MKERHIFHWTQEANLYIELMFMREFTRGFRAIDKLKSIDELNHILDAGCGFGNLTRDIAERLGSNIISGCDIDRMRIEECKLKNKLINYFEHDLLKALPTDKKYDLIIFTTALAQFSSSEQKIVLDNACAQLNKGGFIWITDVNNDATNGLFVKLKQTHTVIYENKYSKTLLFRYPIFPLAKYLPLSFLHAIDRLMVGSNVLTQMIIKIN